MLDEIGFAALVSTFGLASISGLAWTDRGILAGAFGLATRLVLAFGLERGLDLASIKNSTPISGFSSAGDSDADFGSDFGAALAAGNSGLATAFALASDLRLPIDASFAGDFALGAGWIWSSGDLGAALALAVDFLLTTGFGGSTGLISGAGSLAAAVLIFVVRLRLITGVGADSAAVEVFATFAASGVFLTVRFFGDFTAFKVFAPGLARLTLARREGGFAAVVFFGFFMATVLAMGGAFASGD